MLYLHGRPYTQRQHVIEHDLADQLAAFVIVDVVEARIYHWSPSCSATA